MRIYKLILAFSIAGMIFPACAPFPKYYSNKQALTPANITRVNGIYSISASIDSDSLENYTDSLNNSAFEKFYRGNGRGSRDTMEIDRLYSYSFSVDILTGKTVEIQYFQDKILFRKFVLEYKLKNGFIYLKNRNFKFSGVPYLLGGIDIKRRRLSVFDGSLIIDEVYHSSGALLLIFGDSKTWTSRYQYERRSE